MSEASETKVAVCVLLPAVILKAVVLFLILPNLTGYFAPRYGVGFGAQGDLYDVIAKNLVEGIGYRIEKEASATMSREPGYVLFLAGIFQLSGYGVKGIQITNYLLVLGMSFMLIVLTKHVTGDLTHGVVATLLFILHPATVVAESRAGVEIVFLFAVLSFMIMLYRATRKTGGAAYFAAGVALGVVVMVRSTPILFPVALLMYWSIGERGTRLRYVKPLVLLVLGMAIVILPWTIRNYSLVRQFVPVGTIAGVAAQEGLYICKALTFGKDFRDVVTDSGRARNEMAKALGLAVKDGPYHQVFYSAADEVVFSKVLINDAFRTYAADPLLWPRCVVKRSLQMWFLGKTWPVTWLNVALQAPLLILATCGGIVLWRRGELRKMSVMLVFVAYMVVLHGAINANARYSVPLVPFIAMLVSVGVVSGWRNYRMVGLELRRWSLHPEWAARARPGTRAASGC